MSRSVFRWTPGPKARVSSAAILLAACSSSAPNAEVTPVPALGQARKALITSTALTVAGDTFIRSGLSFRNEGSATRLQLQSDSTHRSLLFFDVPALRAAVGSGTLLSARIELTLASVGTNWGSGRSIGIHALRQQSREGGATWSCAIDANVFNQTADCSGATDWNMGSFSAPPFAASPTATTVITSGQTGVVGFDVTSDVAAIAAGTSPGHGWLIKKVDENLSGSLQFFSREGGVAPRLILEMDVPDPCVPSAGVDATCDGVDDDCDGNTDEEFAAQVTQCGVGACVSTGATSCALGQLVDSCAAGAPAPSDATCDLIDEDCDGIVDEEFVSQSTACGVGICASAGETSCALGLVSDSCTAGAPADTDASCNGADDDCDGATDEEFATNATSCGVGTCASVGETRCAGGQVSDSCTPGLPAASDASCDLLDDDCDGLVDEDYVALATSCGVGACGAEGATACVLGEVVDSCSPGAPAVADATCDDRDDDCDGASDEDYASVATSCGVGACVSAGATSCLGGQEVDGCVAGAPASLDASCDGVDDDCDGALDEDFAPACAGTIAQTCSGGSIVSVDCSDANLCNGSETCSGAAQCHAGLPPETDDANPCTTDACDPAVGVTHVLLATGSLCGEFSACTEGGECRTWLPPDPADVAPELPVGSVSLLDRARFIFEGPAPIQSGVAAAVLNGRRVAVLRGRVIDAEGRPVPNVTISVHGQPQLGQTLSRIDGEYDLVVNGGGPVTLEYDASDLIDAQRTIHVPWQDYTFVDDVALLRPDTRVTEIELSAATAQLHHATTISDSRGERTARLYFPAGTTAEMVLSDGSALSMSSLAIRATELTVGELGASSLPANLPETSAYTYAIELSADEGQSLGAERVELSQAASLYVDNFLALPVGSSLPLGSYDRDSGRWLGLANGSVIQLLGVEGGVAVLDVDGEGLAAAPERLSELGISSEELAELAQSYAAGDALWRARLSHFAPFDLSLPFRAEVGSGGSSPAAPGQLSPLDEPGIPLPPSETQVLAQALDVAGTPFTLHYRSDRVLGFKPGQTLNIPATGASVSDSLLGSVVEVQIGGQKHTFALGTEPALTATFSWDGLDGEGRALHGWHRADIRVGLSSPSQYMPAGDFDSAFAHTSQSGAALGTSSEQTTRWLRYERHLHTFDARQTSLGAWSIGQHHSYDPVSRVLYKGDGSQRSLRTASTIIDRFAGVAQGSVSFHSGDGGPALAARLDSPRSLAVGPDGTVFIGTQQGVRRVDAETNIITTVAGGREVGSCDPNLQEGPAVAMCVFARSVDVGPDGALYIGDNPIGSGTFDRIRRLDLGTGRISHVAGKRPVNGCVDNGDGGLAENASICNLIAHATAPDGSIYVLDRGPSGGPQSIRKISTNGIIETIGAATWSGADDSAAVDVGPDGSVYVTQLQSVLRLLPTGEVQHFAGDPSASGSTGDGGAAVLARFGNGGPAGIDVGPDGRVFVGDNGNARIRMIDQQGIIHRFAGTSPGVASGNGGSPLLAVLGTGVIRSAVAPDGAVYLTSRANHTIRVIRPTVGGNFAGDVVALSEDGAEVYRFAPNGRHLETLAAATGEPLYSFAYDAGGWLIGVTDPTGDTTLIERDPDGNPTAIVAATGEETLLDTTDGYVGLVIGPEGAETELDYGPGGLLTRVLDSSGEEHTFTYDAEGRLTSP
jgi:YD repeat-containing protein